MAHVPFMECGGCGEDFPLTPKNAVIARFSEEPDYDYVLAQCECEMWNRNFIPLDTIQMLLRKKIPLVQEKYAPGEVHEAYCYTRDIPLVSARELTTSEEHLVEYFRWLLERGDQE